MNNTRNSLNIPLLIGLALLLAVLAGALLLWEPKHEPLTLASVPQGGDFQLASADGPVALKDFRGRSVVLYFGYTQCPDICPTSLGFLTNALESLDEADKGRIQTLFISLDPERDSLEHLKTYSKYFSDDFIGLTGTEAELAKVAAAYGVGYRKVKDDSELGYSLDHSADLYLIDTQGQLKTRVSHGTPVAGIAKALKDLLHPDLSKETQ